MNYHREHLFDDHPWTVASSSLMPTAAIDPLCDNIFPGEVQFKNALFGVLS
jgi:hypothetical protein